MNVLFLFRGGDVPEDKKEENMKAWGAYMEELQKRGVLRAGLPISGGKVVSSKGVTEYKASHMDVAGFMQLEVDSMESAVKAAHMAPNVRHGGEVEIREGM